MSRFDQSLMARALAAVRGSPKPGFEPTTVQDSAKSAKQTAIEVAADLCRRFEGFMPHPYLCSAGVSTIGYGATHYLDGRRVTLKDPPISRETAERLLLQMIETKYMLEVLQACPELIHESPERLAAIIDFTYNCGAGNLRASTLRRRINEERWDEVPEQLMRWNKAGGRVLRGLTIRRQAEADLI